MQPRTNWHGGTGNRARAGLWPSSAYAVPKDKSHYEVRYCCVAASYGLESKSFQEMSGYHGEMAVDPATGIIARLTVEAELEAGDPISRASIAVEYGPVELGGMAYICPSRSVSISVAKTIRNMQDPSGHSWPTMGPRQMLLNHVDFDQYHLFRAETRVLSGSEERAAGLAPDATLSGAQPAERGSLRRRACRRSGGNDTAVERARCAGQGRGCGSGGRGAGDQHRRGDRVAGGAGTRGRSGR